MDRKQLFKDMFGWGLVLWVFGYLLGVALFPFVPLGAIGWVIMPFGTILMLWVLTNKVKKDTVQYYLLLAATWTLIAVVFDYFFLVKVLMPPDGYYKFDVYLYYALTLGIPVAYGLFHARRGRSR